jgi:acetate---CoA ligase (ADP-forming)
VPVTLDAFETAAAMFVDEAFHDLDDGIDLDADVGQQRGVCTFDFTLWQTAKCTGEVVDRIDKLAFVPALEDAGWAGESGSAHVSFGRKIRHVRRRQVIAHETQSMTADIVLRDGTTLHVRPAARADREGLPPSFFEQIEGHGSWLREFDHTGQGQQVVVGEVGGHLQVVAGYRLRPGSPGRAEVAMAVAAGFEGRGVGTRVLELLADHARAAGVHVFDAWVPRHLRSVVELFASSGFAVSEHPDGGPDVLHVSLDLGPTADYLARSAARARQAATASMRPFFEPRGVAVVGVNRERGRIGSEVFQNLIGAGCTVPVYPVHPAGGTLHGHQAYARVSDIPGVVDLAVVVVPAAHVIAAVDDCIKKGVKALVVISAGFGETGVEGRALEADLLERVRAAGVRMVGPNCMGLLNTNPAVNLNATFSPVYPPIGTVAMSTQSGALGLAILDYARRLGLGISTFVSVGNKADVSSNDLIQYWAEDPHTKVILLYLESFGNPRKFSQIARRVAREKPIVAVKSGRSTSGARAASSHTGALASRDAVVDALFRQAGVIRTTTLEELFDVASVLASQPVPTGRRVAILTNAGGPGILAADACEAQGLTLPLLSDDTVAELRSFLPAAASVGNPVDMIASATAEHYRRALTALLRDDRVDSVLVIFIPPLVTHPKDVAEQVRAAAGTAPDKPVLGIFMSAEGGAQLLAPIPCFEFPESAAVALARAATYGEWRATAVEAVPDTSIEGPSARAIVEQALARGGVWLTPQEASAMLAAAGVPVPDGGAVETEDEAVAEAARIGGTVVLKAVGPTILHKTEVGGVRVGLVGESAVRAAWQDMRTRLGDAMTGGLVQAMVGGGVEMLVGVTDDPIFGPVVACASGGILAELLQDADFRLHPLTERDADAMIASLRGAALLKGHRGGDPADIDALRDVLLRVSALVTACPEIQELDINPLRVMARGAHALDVRIRVGALKVPASTRRIAY